jgi:hypothetical protein
MSRKNKKKKKYILLALALLAALLYFKPLVRENVTVLNVESIKCEDGFNESLADDIVLGDQSDIINFEFIFNKPKLKKFSQLKMLKNENDIFIYPEYVFCPNCKEERCTVKSQIENLSAGIYEVLPKITN